MGLARETTLPYMVKHKVLIDKQHSIVGRSFSLWAPAVREVGISILVYTVKEPVCFN